MILFRGRKAIWKGKNVIILEVLAYGRVKVAYESNGMILIVKRDDVERRIPKWMK